MPFERKAQVSGGWMSVGFEFGGLVVLFFLAGRWADGHWGTHPWLTLVGTLLGVAGGMTLLIRRAVSANAKKDDEQP